MLSAWQDTYSFIAAHIVQQYVSLHLLLQQKTFPTRRTLFLFVADAVAVGFYCLHPPSTQP